MLEYGIDALGFNVAFYILGMAGGFVRSITKDHITIKAGAINIFVGGVVACYFTPIIAHHTLMRNKDTIFATALGLGFCAMGLFTIYDHIESWAKKNPKFFVTQFANWLAATARHLGAKPSDTPHGGDQHADDDYAERDTER
jgi:hypothetical protein